jgi:hypothetical protein
LGRKTLHLFSAQNAPWTRGLSRAEIYVLVWIGVDSLENGVFTVKIKIKPNEAQNPLS